MAETILGKVTMTPKGAYAPETVYARLDIVSFRGSSYIVLQDDTKGVEPPEAPERYFLLAEKGEAAPAYLIGDGLKVTETQEGKVLSVDTVDQVEDNTRPITAAAVYTAVGNVEALLSTI